MAVRVDEVASVFREVFGEPGSRECNEARLGEPEGGPEVAGASWAPGNGELKFVRAPGRVNLLGEHTDYTGGFVLPVALDLDVVIGFRPREDGFVRLYSINYKEGVEFPVEGAERDSRHAWSNYFRGVACVLRKRGVAESFGGKLKGLDAVVGGDVPKGAGLSSSAAFEVASAMALLDAAGVAVKPGADGCGVSPLDVAKLCQEAENEFVGVRCGIMDQMACVLGRAASALFLDCRSLEYELVPLPFDGVKLVICDTGVRRGLVQSEYNRRRGECEAGAELIGKLVGRPSVRTLRDVEWGEFEKVESLLPQAVAKRCAHVIAENERVLRGTRALRRGDVQEFGLLMNESHESLRDLYEVSCEALDAMVETARAMPGVLGARMTGGGFGGCTINLVRQDAVPRFASEVIPLYLERMGADPRYGGRDSGESLGARASAFVVNAADGARSDREGPAGARF